MSLFIETVSFQFTSVGVWRIFLVSDPRPLELAPKGPILHH